MPLIKPDFGLIFWMLIGFGILFFILAKFAWPVITSFIKKREQFIQDQLSEAERARQEMKNLKSEHLQLLKEAKEERDHILADARKIIEKMNDEAKVKRDRESEVMLESTRKAIQNEKMKAITEIKNEIALLSIDIAEKILNEELASKSKQEEIIHKWVQDMSLN